MYKELYEKDLVTNKDNQKNCCMEPEFVTNMSILKPEVVTNKYILKQPPTLYFFHKI